MTINEVQDSIIEEFSIYDDWLDKYNYIIELAVELTKMDKEIKSPDNLISGCQSKVWLNADLVDGKIVFTADSDAIITKGIIALLIKVCNNRTPKEIINSEIYFIGKIGLEENLSPTRANGLLSMMKKIKLYALAYNSKINN
jgi:cysteine desulfuration protein SufE